MEAQVLSLLTAAVVLAAFCAGVAVGRVTCAGVSAAKRPAWAAAGTAPESGKPAKASAPAAAADTASTMERHMINILTYDGKPQGDNRK